MRRSRGFDSFEELRAWFHAKKRVRVMDDETFVHAECERAMPGTEDEVAPVGWNGFMSQMLGKVYKIEDVEVEDQSAELAAVPGEKNCWWPYTTLLKVEWD
jgi:hypothetical protein